VDVSQWPPSAGTNGRQFVVVVAICDPVESAKQAGLCYTSDSQPGIRRQRRGRGFSYYNSDNKLIRDSEERDRLEALAIPPAWEEVWICPLANGHLQATGRDAKGRKQYRYHPRWRKARSRAKFSSLLPFSQSLPQIRARCDRDLQLRGLPKQKVLAAVVRLLETTYIRVGNAEYARENQSYGLTTLRDRHVEVSGATVRFQFTGKSNIQHDNPLLSLSEKLSIFRILEDRQGKRLRPFFRVVIPQSAKLTKMRSLHPGSLTIAWLQKLLIRGKTGE
jgi:DNA topoisomerase-1